MTSNLDTRANLSHGFIIIEAPGTDMSRTHAHLGPSVSIRPGLVLGLVSDPGCVVPLDFAASDGSEIAFGVALLPAESGPARPGRGGLV